MSDTDRKKALYEARRSGVRPVVTPVTRVCTICREEKASTEFRRSWHNDSGLEAVCRPCIAEKDRLRNYGVSRELFEALYKAQAGLCAICGRPETARANNGLLVKSLAVDHDHETGVVRGLLCSQCNKGIGNLGEDPDRLLAAATYLLRHADVPEAVI